MKRPQLNRRERRPYQEQANLPQAPCSLAPVGILRAAVRATVESAICFLLQIPRIDVVTRTCIGCTVASVLPTVGPNQCNIAT